MGAPQSRLPSGYSPAPIRVETVDERFAIHSSRFQNWSDDTLAFYLDLFSELKLFFERASQAGNIVVMGLF